MTDSETTAQKRPFVNVSGRLLADDAGQDWPSDAVREIDPAHPSMQPLIDSGRVKAQRRAVTATARNAAPHAPSSPTEAPAEPQDAATPRRQARKGE